MGGSITQPEPEDPSASSLGLAGAVILGVCLSCLVVLVIGAFVSIFFFFYIFMNIFYIIYIFYSCLFFIFRIKQLFSVVPSRAGHRGIRECYSCAI